MSLRSQLRAIRDRPLVNWGLRTPFRALQRAGVSIPPRVTQHLVYRGPFTVDLQDGRRFEMLSHGHKVENNLYWHGLDGHERASLDAWIELARDSRTVLDIGANTGLFALVAAAEARARVIAFEPVPRIAELCRANVSRNPQLDIEVRAVAVGEEVGVASIYDPGGSNAYSASLQADFLLGQDCTSYEVPVTTVDALVQESGLERVDLVKLDVEGHEAAALHGMQRTLAEARPAMLIEFLAGNDALGRELEGLIGSGYALYWLTEQGRVRQHAVQTPPQDSPNVLLLPEPREAKR